MPDSHQRFRFPFTCRASPSKWMSRFTILRYVPEPRTLSPSAYLRSRSTSDHMKRPRRPSGPSPTNGKHPLILSSKLPELKSHKSHKSRMLGAKQGIASHAQCPQVDLRTIPESWESWPCEPLCVRKIKSHKAGALLLPDHLRSQVKI